MVNFVNNGFNRIRDLIVGKSVTDLGSAYIGLGSGSTATALTDTALQTVIDIDTDHADTHEEMDTGFPSDGVGVSSEFQITVNYNDVASYTFREAGLFDGNLGTMIMRNVFSDNTVLSAGEDLKVYMNIKIQDGAS